MSGSQFFVYTDISKGKTMGAPIRRYGEMLRERRESLDLGLREFADLVGIKASNLSDIETGKKKPHFDAEMQAKILVYLQVQENSPLWYSFFDAVARERNERPGDLFLSFSGPTEFAITSLLRTVSRKQLTEKQLRDLEEYLNKEQELGWK